VCQLFEHPVLGYFSENIFPTGKFLVFTSFETNEKRNQIKVQGQQVNK
jgi:hypothetical protein